MPRPPSPEQTASALERMGSLIDRTLHHLAPRVALRREIARARLNLIRIHGERLNYQAGQQSSRFGKWRTTSGDADASTRGGMLKRIRDRSRDLYRNNAYARRGIRIMTSNVVGTGIRPQPFEGDQPDTALTKAVEEAWAGWAESTECDADGDRDLYGIQRLVQRTAMMSGEALVRRRVRKNTDGLKIPLQLQVLEPDYLDTTKDGDAMVGNQPVRRIQGVEFDMIHRRRGYWMFKDHPGASSLTGNTGLISNFVPASEILHVRATDRPGQVRGIPALTSCVVRLHDVDEFLDATLMKAKIASMLAGFIETNSPEDELPSASAEKDEDDRPIVDFEPGTIEILPDGKKITFSTPPSLEGIPDYVKVELRAIASAIDVTYEQLTGDYSNVSFISGRMGWIENRQAVDEWRWDVLVPQFCTPVWAWFDQIASLALGLNVEGTRPLWTAPRREMIDPKAEVDATRLAIRTGLTSLSQAIRENGDDPDDVLRELSGDVKKAKGLGLMLECDPAFDSNRANRAASPTANPKPPAA